MSIEMARDALLWCAVINYGCCSFGSCSLSWPAISCTDFMAVGFQLSRQQFDIIHYAGMGIFKLGIILFNVVPFVALRMIG